MSKIFHRVAACGAFILGVYDQNILTITMSLDPECTEPVVDRIKFDEEINEDDFDIEEFIKNQWIIDLFATNQYETSDILLNFGWVNYITKYDKEEMNDDRYVFVAIHSKNAKTGQQYLNAATAESGILFGSSIEEGLELISEIADDISIEYGDDYETTFQLFEVDDKYFQYIF